MNARGQKSKETTRESEHERDCRLLITRSLAQRTSSKVPWFRAIGLQNAESATTGLLDCQGIVPRDLLRVLDLPPNLTWARLAVFLRGSLPASSTQNG
ncbi:MAG: hypothetical protein ACRD3S_07390 [Terracidiphilus sp.]